MEIKYQNTISPSTHISVCSFLAAISYAMRRAVWFMDPWVYPFRPRGSQLHMNQTNLFRL